MATETLSSFPSASALNTATDYVIAVQYVPALSSYVDVKVSFATLQGILPVNSLAAGVATTLPYGTPATISITGVAPNQTLNLGIPQGAPGLGNVSTTGTISNGTPAVFSGTTGLITSGATTGTGNIVLASGPTLASPVVGTQSPGDNSTKAASTAFVTASFLTITTAAATYLTQANAATTYLTQSNAAATYAAKGANTDITSLASPALGAATATTQTVGDNTTRVATTAFVMANGSGSAFPSTFSTKSANYTVLTTDKNTLFTLTGSFTLSLPSASSFGAGKGIFLRKVDGNGVWAVTPTSGTIDGLSSISVYQERFGLVSDGTNWVSVDRPKGWVNLGTNVVSSNVSAVLITNGFADPELNEIQIDVISGNFSASDNPSVRLQKNGSVVTTSTYAINSIFISGSSATANSSTFAYFNLGLGGFSTDFKFTLTIQGFMSSVIKNQRVKYEGFQQVSSGYYSGEGWESTSAPIQGVSIQPIGANTIAAGSFNQRGFRP